MTIHHSKLTIHKNDIVKNIFLLLISLSCFIACDPQRDDGIQLGPSPDAPLFTAKVMDTDSNRVIVTSQSDGNFQLLWDLPGGIPKSSNKAVDTILYTDIGEYTITLYASKADGNGTSSSSQKVQILRDAPLECNDKLELLTNCGSQSKGWTFTHAAGAIKVGPEYGDFSWYTSPEDGLQDAQYDDVYYFTFLHFVFQNSNGGQSVNPWNGYAAEDYDPGISEFLYLEGTGTDGRDQIIIPDDQFMGTWDTDNVMDVMTLTENELVVRARIRAQDGTPAAQGWFDLTFVPY